MRVIAIRPEPGLAATIEAGRALGVDIEAVPLFSIASCDWSLPPQSEFDGLLIGSANAVRHAGVQLAGLRDLPVLAVGGITAATARDAGFSVEQIGSGGLQELLDSLGDVPRRLLRLAGEQHVPLAPPPHIALTLRVVYRSQPHQIALEKRDLIEGGLVLLHSGVAAQHFAQECQRLGLDRSRISLGALGARIAAAAGGGWREVRIATQPSDAALLALAQDMCQ